MIFYPFDPYDPAWVDIVRDDPRPRSLGSAVPGATPAAGDLVPDSWGASSDDDGDDYSPDSSEGDDEDGDEDTSLGAVSDEDSDDADDTEEGDDAEEDDDDGEPKQWEFSFGGSKLLVDKDSVPEEVAAEVQRYVSEVEAAHTKRSQKVAETTKRNEEAYKVLEDLTGLQSVVMEDLAEVKYLDKELTKFSNLDMDALWRDSPDQARRLSDMVQDMRARREAASQKVAEGTNAYRVQRDQAISKREQQGREEVYAAIPDFKVKQDAVIEYAMEKYGVSEADAATWGLNPIGAQMAYKAMLWDQMQTSKAQKMKVTKKPGVMPASGPVKPQKGKGSKATSAKDLNRDAHKMSGDEWLKRRNAELARKAKNA